MATGCGTSRGRDRRPVATLLVAAVLLLSCACTSVTVDRPFGVPQSVDAAAWEGAWENEEGEILEVRVLDAAKGLIEVSPEEAGPVEQPPERLTVTLRSLGGWLLAFFPEEPGGEEGYLWGRIANRGGRTVLFWIPSYDDFAAAVDDGTLSGSRTGSSVHLTDLQGSQIEFIVSRKACALFEWDAPLLFTRPGGDGIGRR